ncbi:mtpn [Symbiodinium microadriaticum]|nr:mtpn [Symbiodinium microadriaticum]
MRHRPDVLRNSEDLAMALGSRNGFYRLNRNIFWRHQALSKHRENILQGDIDFNYKGNNLLERAVANLPPGDVEDFASVLMNGGADVNHSSRDGYTPLLSACSRGLAKVARVLLQRGARRHETGPRGSTALEEALAFFRACVDCRAYEREEDLDLGRLCCSLRSDSIEMARRQGLPELTSARLRLSEAATEKALLGNTSVTLTQEETLAKSGLDKSFAEGLGPELWEGWPYAFLTFGLDIPTSAKTASRDFTNARSRILSFKLGQENEKKRDAPCVRGFDDSDVESQELELKLEKLGLVPPRKHGVFDAAGFALPLPWQRRIVQDCYICECSICCPELYIGFGEWAEEVKTRNRKWDMKTRDGRRSRRVPVANGVRGHSYSARMARRMPSAYRGYHVAETLRGGHKKLRKFQLVQEQLRMDTCPL